MEKYKFTIVAPDGSTVFTSGMKAKTTSVAQKDGNDHLNYWKKNYPVGSRVEVKPC